MKTQRVRLAEILVLTAAVSLLSGGKPAQAGGYLDTEACVGLISDYFDIPTRVGDSTVTWDGLDSEGEPCEFSIAASINGDGTIRALSLTLKSTSQGWLHFALTTSEQEARTNVRVCDNDGKTLRLKFTSKEQYARKKNRHSALTISSEDSETRLIMSHKIRSLFKTISSAEIGCRF